MIIEVRKEKHPKLGDMIKVFRQKRAGAEKSLMWQDDIGDYLVNIDYSLTGNTGRVSLYRESVHCLEAKESFHTIMEKLNIETGCIPPLGNYLDFLTGGINGYESGGVKIWFVKDDAALKELHEGSAEKLPEGLKIEQLEPRYLLKKTQELDKDRLAAYERFDYEEYGKIRTNEIRTVAALSYLWDHAKYLKGFSFHIDVSGENECYSLVDKLFCGSEEKIEVEADEPKEKLAMPDPWRVNIPEIKEARQ